MNTFSSPHPAGVFAELDGHEQVVFCADEASGLRAIVAIHSTALGPALGGTRFYPYADEAAALTDVLHLAKGMSYKQIADRLVLSHRTVQNHVQNTLRKLQMHNRVELTRYAIAQGLDEDDPDEAG